MPGQHQNLYIPLSGGIESDIEDTLLPIGKSLTINNMSAYESGTLRKRFAYALRSSSSSFTVPPTWQLGRHKGADISLSVPGQNPYLAWSPTQGQWQIPFQNIASGSSRRGPLQAKLTKLTTSGSRPQILSAGGYLWLLRQTPPNDNSVSIDVIDPVTNHTIKSFSIALINTPDSYCWAVVNGYVVIASKSGFINQIRFDRIQISNFATPGPTFFVAVPGNHGLDMIATSATQVTAIYSDLGGSMAAVDYVPSTATATGWTPQIAAAAVPGDAGFCWVNDIGASGKLAMAVATNSATGLRVLWDFPASGATRSPASVYTIDTTARTQYRNIVAHTIDATSTGAFQVVYSYTSGGATGVLTNIGYRTSGGSLVAGALLVATAAVISKAWMYNSEIYIAVGRVSATLGASYALCIFTAQSPTGTAQAPQAQFAMGLSGALNWKNNTIGYSTEVIAVSANVFVTAVQYIRRLSAVGDTLIDATQYAIALVTLTYGTASDNSTGPPVELVDSTIVPGGTIGAFDGSFYTEMGHASAPDTCVLTPGSGGGSLTPSSTYWYQVVWIYQDGQGRVWRSAPSILQSVTLSAAALPFVTMSIPTPAITGFPLGGGLAVEIYRGAANATTPMQKLAQLAVSNYVGFAGYVDSVADTELAKGETLYTTGGILPAEIFPGSSFVFGFQNRVWFVSNDDPTEIWFSDLITPKNGPRFNSANVVRIADSHGGVIGASVFDDKVVAFKPDAIYTWNGDGPDAAGNGQFSQPQIVALGVGTTYPRSIVATPDGVMFDSVGLRPGIQMIDRGLALATIPVAPGGVAAPVGEAVLRYTSETIMSAIVVPDQSQVRFYCLSGLMLIYDFIQKIWMTHDLKDVVGSLASATATGSGVLTVNSSGGTPVFLAEDITAASYLDLGSTAFASSLGSPWIQVDGVNGFERVMGFIGKGLTVANHSFRIDMYIDYQTTIATTKTFNMTVAASPTWNWEWIPRIQRMKAFRLVFTEINPVNGAAFRCNGFTAKLGIKGGLGRQATVTRG